MRVLQTLALPLGYGATWWLGTESNRRHEDFQSSALPTELPSHRTLTLRIILPIDPAHFPISRYKPPLPATFRNGIVSFWMTHSIREAVTLSIQTDLPCRLTVSQTHWDMPQRGAALLMRGGSVMNCPTDDWQGQSPRYKLPRCKPLCHRTRPMAMRWLRGQDLNLRPSGYEPDELPTAPPRYVWSSQPDSNW